MAINDVIGHEIGIGDRLGGALLGAIRVGLIAVTLVLIFDQLVPADRQPAYMTGLAAAAPAVAGRAEGRQIAAAGRDGHHRAMETRAPALTASALIRPPARNRW